MLKCKCGQRASGLFKLTIRTNKWGQVEVRTIHRCMCAACAFNIKSRNTTAELVRSFSTTHKPPEPKPELPRSPDFYIIRQQTLDELLADPSRPYRPNFASDLGYDPNPEWLR